MGYKIDLPTDDKQLEEVLNYTIMESRRFRNIPEVNWWVAHYYLQGARTFDNVNYETGTLDISYVDEDGVLNFKYEDIVQKYQTQLGRLYQIDLAPAVEKRNIGIEDMRKASIAQVALRSVMTDGVLNELKTKVCPPLTKYGCVGLALWVEDEQMGIDVVSPWELVPLPPNPIEDHDIRGIARHRIVPMSYVQELNITPGKSAKVWAEMDKVNAPNANAPKATTQFSTFTQTITDTGRLSGGNSMFIGGKKKQDQTHVDYVEFSEVWIDDGKGYLDEYILLAGQRLVYRSKDLYKGRRIKRPIQVATDFKTGNFWGRGFVSILLAFNNEMEYSLGRMFQNIQDIDVYGLLVEPTTMGLPAEIMRGSDGIKRVRYEPDYTAPDLKPFNISPQNAGLLPVRVLEASAKLYNQLANQPSELLSGGAPGRVDSNSALGFLYEASNTPLAPTALSLATAVENCYAAMLSMMQMEWDQETMIGVSMLDDTIAGITFDAGTGQMSLASNAIPSPEEVNIKVASMLPKSKEQQKMELAKSLELGIITAMEYRIEARKKGLDIPVGNETEWQNYRRAVMENIMLFGDGQKPGKITVDNIDMHDVHIMVLRAFMARPEYHQASDGVRNAFKQHYTSHMVGMGIYPDQLPYPEQAAEEQDMMNQMQMQGQMPQMV
jgi:hypothetical protein